MTRRYLLAIEASELENGLYRELSSFLVDFQGIARTQSPTIKNNAPEFLTFGEIASLQRHRGAMVGLHLSGPP